MLRPLQLLWQAGAAQRDLRVERQAFSKSGDLDLQTFILSSSRTSSSWTSRISHPLQRASAVASDLASTSNLVKQEQLEVQDREPQGNTQLRKTGAFQQLPIVPSAEEHITSALRRANRVPGNKTIKNKAQYARNIAARRLDALTKEIATPLGKILRGFPSCGRLHPFERALLDLTLGVGFYESRLARLDQLRKSCLEVGKSFAGQAAKAANMKEAYRILDEGFSSMEALYRKNAEAVDNVKDAARLLRKLPVVNPAIPTIALVGAPNVGKSSLVQILSSGMPEICDYPFTTRTVKMGHFFVDGSRHQVTDTPGLLNRDDKDRNAMERLTLACLQFLPTSVLFVADLTGQCGTKPEDQWQIRRTLRAAFPHKRWLDVFSKADLLEDVFKEAEDGTATELSAGGTLIYSNVGEDTDSSEQETPAAVQIARENPQALKISSVELTAGIDKLKESVLEMMANAMLGDPGK